MRTPTLPVFVGRESELATLQRCLTTALHGQRQLVFIAGEPGIGKTALVDAFLEQLPSSLSVSLGRGQCVEHYGAGEAYLPLLEALSRLGREPGGEEVAAVLAKYAPTWLAQLPTLIHQSQEQALLQTPGGATRERMLRELAEALEVLSARQPLLFILEDLHWSDPSTLDMLTYLARRRDSARFVIMSTYRPIEVSANGQQLKSVLHELQGRGQAATLRLSGLTAPQVAVYLTERFGIQTAHDPLVRQLAHTVHQRTEGNPLFMVTVIEQLARERVIEKTPQGWRVRAERVPREVGVPEGVRQLIERHLERLRPEDQRMLDVASVAGMEFGAAAVAAGMGQAIEKIEEQCANLAKNEQFVKESGMEEWPDGTLGGRYRFQHALYHEVVYTRLTEVRRIQLHRRIGERKATAYGKRAGDIAAELAMHFEAGQDYQRAVEYLTRAGENALRRSAHAEAIRHLTTALSLLTILPDSPQRVQQELRVQVTLGAPLVATKGYAAPEVEATYLRASTLCQQAQDTPHLFPALWGLWAVYAVRPDHRKALELGEHLLDLTQQQNDSGSLVQAHWAVGQPLLYMGRFPQAQEHFEQGWALYDLQRHCQNQAPVARAGQDPGVNCLAMASRALWALGYPDQALKKSYEALALARDLQHPLSIGFALALVAMTHQLRREAPAAQEKAEAAIAVCREYGFSFYLAAGTIWQGWALAEQGQPGEGIAQLRQGLAAWRATGAELVLSHYLTALAEAHERAGQIEESWMALSEGLSLAEKHEEHFYEAELYRLQGELTLRQFQVQGSQFQVTDPRSLTPDSQAAACFLKALDIARQQQAKSLELRAAMSLARLWQCQGKIAEARALLEPVYGWFTEGFETKDLQEARALLVALGGSGQQAAEAKEARTGRREPARQAGNWRLRVSGPSPSSPFNFQPGASSLSQDSGLRTHYSSVFCYDGKYWTLTFEDLTCRLTDLLGMRYLAHLLQHPYQEIPVHTLASEQLAGTEIAKTAVLQSKEDSCENSESEEPPSFQSSRVDLQRVQELQEELAEADAFHDIGRKARLQAELEMLTESLLRQTSAGKKAEPALERLRLNVTRAIKTAIRRITDVHPTLGRHLTRAIKTGASCSYHPTDTPPIPWQV